MNYGSAQPFALGKSVKLMNKMIVDRTPSWIKVGQVGRVTDKRIKAVLVKFENGDRWCWPDELELV